MFYKAWVERSWQNEKIVRQIIKQMLILIYNHTSLLAFWLAKQKAFQVQLHRTESRQRR